MPLKLQAIISDTHRAVIGEVSDLRSKYLSKEQDAQYANTVDCIVCLPKNYTV